MKELVKLRENEDVFIVNNIYEFIDPSYIYVAVNNIDNFKTLKYLNKNTYINDFVVSSSGKLVGFTKKNFLGKTYSAIKIENDFKENMEVKLRHKKIKNKEDLLNLLTKFKLKEMQDKITKDVKEIVITCFDEEIYVMNEFMTLTNYYEEVMQVIDLLKNIFNLNNITLAIKNTNAKSIKNVKSINGIYPDIKVVLLPDLYLMSYKENICSYLNKDVNDTTIFNVSDIYNLSKILNGKTLCEKIITVSGDALKKSLIINVKIGTSLKEIINKYMELITDDYEVYLNGYLRGTKIDDYENLIITKDTYAIVINKNEDSLTTSCINCGACKKICPKNISVKKCYFNKESNSSCINCGLCNYICPAKIKLKEVVRGEDNETI